MANEIGGVLAFYSVFNFLLLYKNVCLLVIIFILTTVI
jgi:hypothetical protein